MPRTLSRREKAIEAAKVKPPDPPKEERFFCRLHILGGNIGVGTALDSAERLTPDIGNPKTLKKTGEVVGGTFALWETMPPLPAPRWAASASVLEGQLYVCGGYDGHTIFSDVTSIPVEPAVDPQAMRPSLTLQEMANAARGSKPPSALPSKEAPVRSQRPSKEAAEKPPSVSSKEAAGERSASTEPSTETSAQEPAALAVPAGKWEPVPNMVRRRSQAIAATLAGKVYVCGGYDGYQALNSVECFSPTEGVWAEVPNMQQARLEPAAAAVQGRLFVCGGAEQGVSLRTVEAFDPQESCWEQMPPMVERRRAAAAGVLNELWICGGHDGRRSLSSTESLIGESWRAMPRMAQPRYHCLGGVVGQAAVFAGGVVVRAGKLYVCGGHDGEKELASAEVLIDSEKGWTSAPGLSQARFMAAGAVQADPLELPPPPLLTEEELEEQAKKAESKAGSRRIRLTPSGTMSRSPTKSSTGSRTPARSRSKQPPEGSPLSRAPPRSVSREKAAPPPEREPAEGEPA